MDAVAKKETIFFNCARFDAVFVVTTKLSFMSLVSVGQTVSLKNVCGVAYKVEDDQSEHKYTQVLANWRRKLPSIYVSV